MRTLIPSAALVALAFSCGQLPPSVSADSGSSTTCHEQSGSRLKRQYLLATDGSEQPLTLYDTTLQKPCAWQPMDGVTQSGPYLCLPIGMTAPVPNPGAYVSATVQRDP